MLRFLLPLLTAGLLVKADQCCNAGWSLSPQKDRCVQVSSQPMIWDQASAACRSMQAALVSIHNTFDNTFIWNLAAKAPNVTFGIWLGGHTNTPMAQQTTGWTWADGMTWNYANWQQGKPDNWQGCNGLGFPDTNQQCLEMWVWHGADPDSAHTQYWNDQCCHRPLNFICEKKPTC
uniref:C-type lectin domain-containing protein n=1 Tax=Plectus sambesii TaxID=2011161 RepID=A0A914V813_9BILA